MCIKGVAESYQCMNGVGRLEAVENVHIEGKRCVCLCRGGVDTKNDGMDYDAQESPRRVERAV